MSRDAVITINGKNRVSWKLRWRVRLLNLRQSIRRPNWQRIDKTVETVMAVGLVCGVVYMLFSIVQALCTPDVQRMLMGAQ